MENDALVAGLAAPTADRMGPLPGVVWQQGTCGISQDGATNHLSRSSAGYAAKR